MLAAIDPNLKWYLTLIVLSVALLVGTVWAWKVWNDVKGEAEESFDDPDDLLAPLAEAFAAGQMSEDEYRRIKESIERGGPSDELPTRAPRPEVVRARPPAESPGPGGPVPPDAPG